MGKVVVFKPSSDYSGENQSPINTSTNLTTYDMQKFINSLSSKQIGKYAIDTTGSTKTVYTVPDGRMFILQACFLTARVKVAGASGDVYLSTTQADVSRLLTGTLNATYNPDCEISITYPFGMIFRAGEKIEVNSGSGEITVWGGVSGFEIPVNS
jgi:hypothetical protein